VSNKPPRPSIYDRLMPLMYGLIGVASTLFLQTLFCGRPVASRCPKCESPRVHQAAARPARAAPDAARPAPRAAPDAALPAPRAAPDALDAGLAKKEDAASADAATHPDASAETLEAKLAAAIDPCVRARARSFRLAVRLHPDGKVRRVFVARDPGVNTTMTECIVRRVGAMPDPFEVPSSYAEWRVRQTDGKLSLTLVRPERLRR
jgi:hypothetical protein